MSLYVYIEGIDIVPKEEGIDSIDSTLSYIYISFEAY